MATASKRISCLDSLAEKEKVEALWAQCISPPDLTTVPAPSSAETQG